MDDLVERLLKIEGAGPDFLGGIDEGRCVTCYHRNPDGPEAADTIIRLKEALERGQTNLRGLQPALNVMAREVLDDIIAEMVAALNPKTDTIERGGL